ncbi:nucleotidyltransferase [Eubacteriales bacterium OttesenSCG-928-K08]|nr:nucleotidyltransferase [Eubacteriales bacterium OttesenSCG-928-K08]
MTKPALVVMAAGIGSRYGGLKQIEPVGSNGELLIDYSLFDAKRAGFEQVIFIINHKIENEFKQHIGDRIAQHMNVEYVYQELNSQLPDKTICPADRIKPWGTGHAVLCCKALLNGPFAVINADDYYGRNAFAQIYNTLKNAQDTAPHQWCMVGYILENTLTDFGYVSRGVCSVTQDHKLSGIVERVRIEKTANGVEYSEDGGCTFQPLCPSSVVSMNLWGFTSPGIFNELEAGWADFWRKNVPEKPTTAEFYLPSVVGTALGNNKAQVQVLQCTDRWYGITHPQDKPALSNAIAQMVSNGLYPSRLWG